MKRKLTSANNKQVELDCIGCSLVIGEIDTIGGWIYNSDNFTIAQDWEIPIEGFFIIGSKRHYRSYADMTIKELQEFQTLLVKCRSAMKEALGIDKVTVIQEEKSETSHFHVWLFPWHKWMEKIGTRLSNIEEIMEYARNSMKKKKNLAEVENTVKIMRNKFK